jgi:hypothetical protein
MINKRCFVVLAALCFCAEAYSQMFPPPFAPPPPPGLPISNAFGLGLLCVSGLIYAVFKLKK